MIKQQLRTAFLIAATVVASPAFADDKIKGDAAAGEIKAQTCMGCHGIKSYTNAYPTYRVPRLWGQNATYIRSALTSYNLGERSHPTMQVQARALNKQDMADIAAFFSTGAEPLPTSTAKAEEGLSELTTKLINEGAFGCGSCHGGNGSPSANNLTGGVPALAGQWDDYLSHALLSYYAGVKGHPYIGGTRSADSLMGGPMKSAIQTIENYKDDGSDKTVREVCKEYVFSHMKGSKKSQKQKFVEVCVQRRVTKELNALAKYFGAQEGLQAEKP